MLSQVLPPGIPVLMLTKGLSSNGSRLSILRDILRGSLPPGLREGLSIAAVGGPSIAGELASQRHTCVVFAGSDEALLEKLRQGLQTPYYNVWTSTDLIGVETCVALKNAYALAVGLVHGWLEREGVADNGAVMHNVAAAIFAQGLYEIAYLVQYMGGQLSSVYSLPGAGDLYVTSMGGRNGRMGRRLALGWNYQEAKAKYMPDETKYTGRILNNLVANAIQHTPAGGLVEIRVTSTAEGILTEVVNPGEGIQPEDLPMVFDKFYRSDKSRSRATGGAGLGLAIARGIVMAYGGRIWVESEPGKLTRFAFTIPQPLDRAG